MSKSNRWVKLADHLPWDRIEREYNKRLRNGHNGAGNKPARMVVGALIVKHVEKLSDEKTIQAILENPYMQYLLGLEKFTERPVFVPELFVLVRKRLDHDFFNMLTLMLAETDGSKPKKEHTDEDGNDIELEYVDALEHEGQTYMAFFPAVEDEADEESEDYGLVILKSVTENGEELLTTLDSDQELQRVYDLFMEQLMDEDDENS